MWRIFFRISGQFLTSVNKVSISVSPLIFKKKKRVLGGGEDYQNLLFSRILQIHLIPFKNVEKDIYENKL